MVSSRITKIVEECLIYRGYSKNEALHFIELIATDGEGQTNREVNDWYSRFQKMMAEVPLREQIAELNKTLEKERKKTAAVRHWLDFYSKKVDQIKAIIDGAIYCDKCHNEIP